MNLIYKPTNTTLAITDLAVACDLLYTPVSGMSPHNDFAPAGTDDITFTLKHPEAGDIYLNPSVVGWTEYSNALSQHAGLRWVAAARSGELKRSEDCPSLYTVPTSRTATLILTVEVPEGYNYVAVDEDGALFAYKEEPHKCNNECWGEDATQWVSCPRVTNWKETLTRVD